MDYQPSSIPEGPSLSGRIWLRGTRLQKFNVHPPKVTAPPAALGVQVTCLRTPYSDEDSTMISSIFTRLRISYHPPGYG